MKYDWEFKLECVLKYRNGEYISVPESSRSSHHDFMHLVSDWEKVYSKFGANGLKKGGANKSLTVEERYELVVRVLNGESYRKVAIDNMISLSGLYQWVKRYNRYGYDGLKLRKGRKPKEPVMKDDERPEGLSKSEKEELILLRRQNEYLKAENAYLKKLRALIVRKKAEPSLKAKRQHSSKNSAKKDTD